MRVVCSLLCLTFGWASVATAAGAATLKVNGSTTVNPVAADAAAVFQERGWTVLVDVQGGSSGGVSGVATGLCDIGMASRPITTKDKEKFPKANFVTHTIGYDGVALVVSRELYDGGVKALTREQVRQIYEGKITNWKDVGGPDRKIVFFNKEPGRGTWEVFADFVYGKADKAPKVFHPEVGANQEARTKVANHNGGITQLSASWAWENPKVAALALVEDGKTIPAIMDTIKDGSYPMRRPLNFLTNGDPSKDAREFIDFVLSPAGQKLVEKHGYLPAKVQTGS